MADADTSPNYAEIEVSCGCGNTFVTRSTLATNLKVEICNQCHPFYTNQQRVIVTNSSMLRFQERYGSQISGTSDGKAAE